MAASRAMSLPPPRPMRGAWLWLRVHHAHAPQIRSARAAANMRPSRRGGLSLLPTRLNLARGEPVRETSRGAEGRENGKGERGKGKGGRRRAGRQAGRQAAAGQEALDSTSLSRGGPGNQTSAPRHRFHFTAARRRRAPLALAPACAHLAEGGKSRHSLPARRLNWVVYVAPGRLRLDARTKRSTTMAGADRAPLPAVVGPPHPPPSPPRPLPRVPLCVRRTEYMHHAPYLHTYHVAGAREYIQHVYVPYRPGRPGADQLAVPPSPFPLFRGRQCLANLLAVSGALTALCVASHPTWPSWPCAIHPFVFGRRNGRRPHLATDTSPRRCSG